MSKIVGISYSIPTPPKIRKDDEINMTCLLHGRTKDKRIIASDTWNHSIDSNDSTYIQKICFNKENKIIIGSAGLNYTHYGDGKKIYVKDMMQLTCDTFNGKNLNEVIFNLINNTFIFLNDIIRGDDVNEIFVQYFITYFNIYTNEVESIQFECLRKKDERAQYLPIFTNMCCTAFGKYREEINQQYEQRSPLSSTDEVLEILENYINKESYLSDTEKVVGGKIHWATIDKEGNIETNIEI